MLSKTQMRIIRNRLVQSVPVLILATFMVFALMKMLPGDVAVTLAGDNPSEERIAEIRALYGLDRPFVVQYLSWLGNALQGDLSQSLLSGEDVLQTVIRVFPNTLFIVLYAMLISVGVGVPLGILAASRPGSRMDGFVMTLSSVGVAVPNFWLAMIFVSAFAVNRMWFPATGFVSPLEDLTQAIWYSTLPALALASTGLAELARQVRSSLTEILSSQYVRTLHAKGLSPAVILWKHGLRNVSVNLLTVIGLLFNRALAATVVIEVVFAIPGVGNSIVNAAIQRDFPVVQGIVLIMVITVILVNLVTDLLYSVLDPRIS